MNISDHITYEEATKSQTAIRKGIDNTPSEAVLATMKVTALHLYEPIRAYWGPIFISSFYRSPKLNRSIGGSKSSQHCLGEAIDLDRDVFGKPTHMELFEWIQTNLDYDQVIYEHTWVHVSYRTGRNRKMAFRIP